MFECDVSLHVHTCARLKPAGEQELQDQDLRCHLTYPISVFQEENLAEWEASFHQGKMLRI